MASHLPFNGIRAELTTKVQTVEGIDVTLSRPRIKVSLMLNGEPLVSFTSDEIHEGLAFDINGVEGLAPVTVS